MNKNWVQIPAATFEMGDKHQLGFKIDKERPVVWVNLDSFYMDTTTVTNQDFRAFIEDTGYQTDAEKYGWSFVFDQFLADDTKDRFKKVPGTDWWRVVEGAKWTKPEGLKSSLHNRRHHPVTHVSRNDAVAYCKWAGCRLPTEAEWELAARGGLKDKIYPWGDDLTPNGEHLCNIWQGTFPELNTLEDNYLGTAPVKEYQPNGYGLYQMSGNVWEWCVNPAKIDLIDFKKWNGEKFWEEHQTYSNKEYALKGGSFLCHESYCNRYRVAARNGNTADSSASNIGFRCVKTNEQSH